MSKISYQGSKDNAVYKKTLEETQQCVSFQRGEYCKTAYILHPNIPTSPHWNKCVRGQWIPSS